MLLHPKEKEIIRQICSDLADPKTKSPVLLRNSIKSNLYDLLTQPYNRWDLWPKDKAVSRPLNAEYHQALKQLRDQARSMGWNVPSDGQEFASSWEQFNKPGGTKRSSKVNFKIYLTLSDDIQSFLRNIRRLGDLMKNLDSTSTKGKVTFKVGSDLVAAYLHRDNVVIHFSDLEDFQGITAAVRASNLTTLDRSQGIARTAVGVDFNTSDSYIVAKYIANELMSNPTYYCADHDRFVRMVNHRSLYALHRLMFTAPSPIKDNQGSPLVCYFETASYKFLLYASGHVRCSHSFTRISTPYSARFFTPMELADVESFQRTPQPCELKHQDRKYGSLQYTEYWWEDPQGQMFLRPKALPKSMDYHTFGLFSLPFIGGYTFLSSGSPSKSSNLVLIKEPIQRIIAASHVSSEQIRQFGERS